MVSKFYYHIYYVQFNVWIFQSSCKETHKTQGEPYQESGGNVRSMAQTLNIFQSSFSKYCLFITKGQQKLIITYFRTTQWLVQSSVPQITETSCTRGRMGSRRNQRRMDTDRMEAAGIWWGANIRRLTVKFVRNYVLKGTSRNIVSGSFFDILSSLLLVHNNFQSLIIFLLVWRVEDASLIKKY